MSGQLASGRAYQQDVGSGGGGGTGQGGGWGVGVKTGHRVGGWRPTSQSPRCTHLLAAAQATAPGSSTPRARGQAAPAGTTTTGTRYGTPSAPPHARRLPPAHPHLHARAQQLAQPDAAANVRPLLQGGFAGHDNDAGDAVGKGELVGALCKRRLSARLLLLPRHALCRPR